MSEPKETFDLKKQWEDLQKTNEDLIEAKAKGHATALKEEFQKNLETAFNDMSDKVNDLTAAVNRKALVADALEEAKDETAEYSAKFEEWMRKGNESTKNELFELESKALSAGGANGAGANAVATPIQNAIARIMLDTSPMRKIAKIQSSERGILEQNYSQNDAASGWANDETTARTTATDSPTLLKVSVTAVEQWAMPLISQTLLDDNYFNTEAWLAEEVAEQFGRLENTAFVNGTGAGQPQGFLDGSGGSPVVTNTWGTYDTILTDTSNTLSGDDLVKLPYNLEAGYRSNGSFVMNRQVLSAVRVLKDSVTGTYLWVPGFGAQPDTILGYGVTEFEDMSTTYGTGDIALAFGDFKRGYGIADRVGMRVTRDIYTKRPMVAFYATKRVGGGIMDSRAVKILQVL